jgi:hypothetical protein
MRKEIQLLLSLEYQRLRRDHQRLPSLDEAGFRVFSESDEDGILLFLFSLLGTTNKRVVDIGASGLRNSNTTNLIVNHGWFGLLIDGDPETIRSLREYYANSPATSLYPPTLVASWVTAENIDSLISKNGFTGGIDLLSLDIDGIDNWVWKAIQCVRPRVVVLEYQAVWGPDKAVTVPNRPDFRAEYVGHFGVYGGASLAAFVKLGREKGYRLVGCHRYGYNAFFVRNGLGEDVLPEVPASACFRHPFTAWAIKELLHKVMDQEWVEV